GSFVSPQGLIITNHHCAYGAIQQASTAERDLLADGFSAATFSDEIPAPDYTVRVTEDYQDVSAEVLDVITPDMSFLERTKAIERRQKEIEASAEKQNPGLRAEVAEMFTGKTYVLFLYTYLKDIRLVFAPPQSVGNFGGEVDNWMWPRHTGDFSFMRAYTAPDGSSATYSADNVPYRPRRHVEVEPAGVQEEDAVFLLGYPGRTARHKTASFLEFEQGFRLPFVVELYNWQIEVMTAAGAEDRDVAIRLASRIRSLANVEKRSRGQLQGLKRANIVSARRAAEVQLQSYIEAEPGRKKQFGDILKKIDAVYASQTERAESDALVGQLVRASRALELAFFLYDYAHQRALPDLKRESAYTDRNIEQSIQRMRGAIRDFHGPTDAKLLSGLVSRLQAAGVTLDWDAQQVADIPGETKVVDADTFDRLLTADINELDQLQDPAMQFVRSIYPKLLEIRDLDKERDGQLSQLYGDLIDIKQKFMATDFVPDANATLRLTCGYIRRYQPADAIIKLPITTFTGVLNKTTGQAPFNTPARVLDAYAEQRFGPFRNQELGDVPVAILYNTDTTGGNSGSPIFNASGKLVGVNFDRCFEATINDFAWNENYSRSIGVDIRYVLWITGYVYEAEHLLREMGVSR
ncbi:MAG TPA: S46 family peptidase, partial [Planctomycetaceae bacterium]|nr:S46 family peptidase [Planctomycetaceae bacterium]